MDLRERVKLKQQDLAYRLGKRQATISAWENGGVPHLKPSEFKAMLDVLQCTVDELVAAFEPDKLTATAREK
ncbi:MAG: helix-turn-helix transcriptional regulator [Leptolyngbya sp. SIO1D8]|nr:helix-turn-helix transcriptional regulator [Leptolyngbya sp. SIO1D8]